MKYKKEKNVYANTVHTVGKTRNKVVHLHPETHHTAVSLMTCPMSKW